MFLRSTRSLRSPRSHTYTQMYSVPGLFRAAACCSIHAPRLHYARTTPSIFGFSVIIQAEPGIPGGKPETRENPGFPGILGRYASGYMAP